MTVNFTTGAASGQDWERVRAARAAQRAGVDAAVGKLASDLGSFVAQLTGATGQTASATADAGKVSGNATDGGTAAADAADAPDGASALADDLRALLTQIGSGAAPQKARAAHHRHAHGPQPAAQVASGPDPAGDQLLSPAATAEFVDRIARAFRSYASQAAAAAPTTPGTSVSA